MTITVLPGHPFVAQATNGIVNDTGVGAALYDLAGNLIGSRVAYPFGVTQPVPGTYERDFTSSPLDTGTYQVKWDTGLHTAFWFIEELVVALPHGAPPVLISKDGTVESGLGNVDTVANAQGWHWDGYVWAYVSSFFLQQVTNGAPSVLNPPGPTVHGIKHSRPNAGSLADGGTVNVPPIGNEGNT